MKDIEFVSYTGKEPNLCRGVLTLLVDGKEYKFGHDYYSFESLKSDKNYDEFWYTGGSCYFTEGYSNAHVKTGPWEIDSSLLPEELKDFSEEIARCFNDNVPFGCCGGCL